MSCENCSHRKFEYRDYHVDEGDSFYYCSLKKVTPIKKKPDLRKAILCSAMSYDSWWLKWKKLKKENNNLLIPRDEHELFKLHFPFFNNYPTNPLKEKPHWCPL